MNWSGVTAFYFFKEISVLAEFPHCFTLILPYLRIRCYSSKLWKLTFSTMFWLILRCRLIILLIFVPLYAEHITTIYSNGKFVPFKRKTNLYKTLNFQRLSSLSFLYFIFLGLFMFSHFPLQRRICVGWVGLEHKRGGLKMEYLCNLFFCIKFESCQLSVLFTGFWLMLTFVQIYLIKLKKPLSLLLACSFNVTISQRKKTSVKKNGLTSPAEGCIFSKPFVIIG